MRPKEAAAAESAAASMGLELGAGQRERGAAAGGGGCWCCTKLVTFVASVVVGLMRSRDPLSYLWRSREKKKKV